MECLRYDKSEQVWRPNYSHSTPRDHQLELSCYKRLLHLTNLSNYCCVIFNFSQVRVEHCSPEIVQLLGIEPRHFTLPQYIRLIHPEDASTHLAKLFKISELFRKLSHQRRRNYKVTQSLRLKHARGHYVSILQQIVYVTNPIDNLLRVFVALSEAPKTYPNNQFRMSIMNRQADQAMSIENGILGTALSLKNLTTREREILSLLMKNMSTNEIAEKISRSPHTVKNHRKNMLRKTGASNTLELIMLAFQEE